MFQEDIYPETQAPVAALTAQEWLDGTERDPVLVRFVYFFMFVFN